MTNQKIIFITGPTGAGKSTISRMLANRLGRCANIEVDHIKHFTEFGFPDPKNASSRHFDEWPLVGEATKRLAQFYLSEDLDLIINGYIGTQAWDNIMSDITPSHAFMLLPDLETLQKRDVSRPLDQQLGATLSEKHHTYFSSADFFDDTFEIIDTSRQTAEQTLENILYKIGK